MVYLATFTIKINQMGIYIPYMDPMGMRPPLVYKCLKTSSFGSHQQRCWESLDFSSTFSDRLTSPFGRRKQSWISYKIAWSPKHWDVLTFSEKVTTRCAFRFLHLENRWFDTCLTTAWYVCFLWNSWCNQPIHPFRKSVSGDILRIHT